MRRFLTRITGIALIIAGVAGLVFAVAGLFALVQVEKQVVAGAQEQVSLVGDALSATGEGLDVAEDSLLQAVETVKALETTVAGVGDTVGSSVPALDSVTNLVGVKLPETIATTRQTLESVAQNSATIDVLLVTLSSIPLLGVSEYSPEVPLSQGFQDVADSLEGIPESLRVTQQQLITANKNLSGLQGTLDTVASDVGGIAASLSKAQSVLGQYKGVVAQLQKTIDFVSRSLPNWIKWLRLGVSALLVWLGIVQFALITQGWELIGRSRRKPEPQASV